MRNAPARGARRTPATGAPRLPANFVSSGSTLAAAYERSSAAVRAAYAVRTGVFSAA
ncbi:hypothetical protein [Streptomyces sp. NPDC002602]|uniref:hypothetical protein n=1 Tax=Streptomyces sp. NPDC002602 TaxID=3364654 RepID=UPI0036A6D35E